VRRAAPRGFEPSWKRPLGPPFPFSRCKEGGGFERFICRAPAAHVSRYQSFRFPRSPPSQPLMRARKLLEIAETRGR